MAAVSHHYSTLPVRGMHRCAWLLLPTTTAGRCFWCCCRCAPPQQQLAALGALAGSGCLRCRWPGKLLPPGALVVFRLAGAIAQHSLLNAAPSTDSKARPCNCTEAIGDTAQLPHPTTLCPPHLVMEVTDLARHLITALDLQQRRSTCTHERCRSHACTGLTSACKPGGGGGRLARVHGCGLGGPCMAGLAHHPPGWHMCAGRQTCLCSGP